MERKCLVFSFAEIEVREGEFCIVKDGEVLPVEPKAFRVLLVLLCNPQKLIPKEELLDAVWGDIAVSENSLTRSIALLRKLLGDDTHEPRFIATVPTVGYRFLCDVQVSENGSFPAATSGVISNSPAQPIKVILPSPTDKPRARSTRRSIIVAAGFLCALLTAGWILDKKWHANPTPTIVPSLTRITWDSGLTTDPTLSADGKFIAYASDRSGEGHLDIYLQQIGGGEPLRLTHGPGDYDDPAFSPDGTTIAFDSAVGGIYVVSTLGGTPRRLATDGQLPQFSPDGKRIIYDSRNGSGISLKIPGWNQIYLVDSAGGVPKQLRPEFLSAAFPIWMPDGQHVLFLGNTEADKAETIDWWVTPLDSGPAVKTGVMEAIRQAKLTSDLQDLILYERPSLDPSGDGLILAGRGGDSTNLWRIPFSLTKFTTTGPPQRMTSGGTREYSPSEVRVVDGKARVAFSNFTAGLSVWSLTIQPNQGKIRGEPEQLTRDAAGDFTPSLSRDAKRIAFVSTRPGQQEVWTKDLRTGQETALTTPHLQQWDPRFSPDGFQVAFTEGPSLDVFVVPSVGGAQHLVLRQGGRVSDWSPDEKRIIGYTVDGRAWVLNLATHERTDLLTTQKWTVTGSFSPDGRWFSFMIVDRDGQHAYVAAASEGPIPESAWIPVTGGKPFAWSPDGNLLYVVSWRDGRACIWARYLSPITKQPMGESFAVFHSHSARLALSNQIERTFGLAGNKLVFSMGEWTGNIWMAEWKQQ